MRTFLACLLCCVAPLASPQAGDIGAEHRGTWTETGVCPQPRRIVVTDKTITLVEPGHMRVLTDADEAVWKGETVLNASLPARKEADPELAFSGRLVEQEGELSLVIAGLEGSKSFAGTFKRCKGASTQTASTGRQRPAQRAASTQTGQRMQRPLTTYPGYPGTLLGGLY